MAVGRLGLPLAGRQMVCPALLMLQPLQLLMQWKGGVEAWAVQLARRPLG